MPEINRDPSLHILRSDLIAVFKKMGFKDSKESMLYFDLEALVDDLMDKAVPYHIKDRYIISGDKQLRKKATKLTATNSLSVSEFNGILMSARLSAKHQFVKNIGVGDPHYATLKEVAQLAFNFVENYKIEPKRDAYKLFCTLGINLMGKKYALNKFKYYVPKIEETYEAYVVVDHDQNPERSKEFYTLWNAAMMEHANTHWDITGDRLKWIHIIFARQEAEEARASYKDWIEAQFDKLAFLSVVPELGQFYGPNALLRYQSYMTTYKVTNPKRLSKKEQEKEEEYNLPEYINEEQKEYFAALRAKRAVN